MQPALQNKTMIDPEPPAKRPRGRPPKRKSQPDVDPSQPLHPWAQQHAASPSTSYRPPPRPTPQPQYATSMHPPTSAPAAVAPISTASFYAHQPPHQPHMAGINAAYARAISVPVAVAAEQPYGRATPEAESPYAVAMQVPRQNVPSRADLEFLLGGPPKVRPRSSTPNAAAMQARQDPRVIAASRSTPALHPSYASNVPAPVAGPSRLSAAPQAAYPAKRRSRTSAPRPSHTSTFFVDEGADISGDYDDGLALGAEAVMESDHEADIEDMEDDALLPEYDDPNDRDFRPNASAAPKRPRHSQTSENAPATSSTPPRTGRRSLASSSTGQGKVPGSATKFDAPVKKRGRPPKHFYTPDVIEKMKVANEILAMASETSTAEGIRLRLDDIIDRKTRQQLSPEMQAAILRARNTQLQRERRERLLRLEAEAAKGKKVQEDKPGKRENLRRFKPQSLGEDEASGAIVERARGKVAEWIKTISSEADQSVEPEEAEPMEAAAAAGPGSSKDGPTVEVDPQAGLDVGNIDPRLEAGGEEGEAQAEEQREEQAVDHFFSRFGKVTGKNADTTAATATADATDGNQTEGVQAGQPYDAGVVGDEYYFST